MRDKLRDRGHSRAVGALDDRVSSVERKLSYTPDIPLAVGTPVVWLDPEVVSMTAGTEQGTFTDRAGLSWAKTTFGGIAGSRSLWQMPNGMNGRNCWRSDGPNDTDAQTGISSMFSSVSIGDDMTSFFVIRMHSYFPSNADGTAAIFARHQTSVATGSDNFFWFYTQTQKFSFDRVDTGQVDTAAASGPAVTHVVTNQSTTARNEAWLDGTVGTNADPANTALVNPRVLYIGCGYPTSPITYYSRCDFGDIIIYNSILSSGDRNIVEKYLGRKYGVTIA